MLTGFILFRLIYSCDINCACLGILSVTSKNIIGLLLAVIHIVTSDEPLVLKPKLIPN